jgi:glutamate formiminotransferase
MPLMHQRAGTGLQLALELSKHRPVNFQEFWWLSILFIYFTMCLELDHSFAVPAFLYGAAHQSGRPLDDIRRALGYFQHNNGGLWIGSNIFPATMQPDCGPRVAAPGSGIVVVGACPWVMNYNVPLTSIDLSKGKRIARKVSARGGGLAKVQAMALLHGTDCIEIACNLLDTEVSSPDAVQHLVATLAAKEGIKATEGYLTGHSKEDIFRLASEKLNAF